MSIVKKTNDNSKGRHFDHPKQKEPDLLKKVNKQPINNKTKSAIFDQIMAYTCQNYNKVEKRYEAPINAYVSINPKYMR